jgi:hypothetical protein
MHTIIVLPTYMDVHCTSYNIYRIQGLIPKLMNCYSTFDSIVKKRSPLHFDI